MVKNETFSWSPTTGLSNPSISNPTASPTVTTTYVLTASSNGCSVSATGVTITVNTTPSAVTVSSSGTYCGSTTLTASGGSGGSIYWQGTTSGGTSTATLSSSQVVSASGTYYFRSRNASGCWGPEGSATVTINLIPTSNAGTDVGICSGSSVALNGSGTNPYTPSVNTYNGSAITINDGNATPYPSTLNVSGLNGQIANIRLTFNNLSHAWPADIDAVLFGPTGAHSIIFTDAIGGSGGISGRNYTFAIGSTALPLTGFPASGTYGVVNGGAFDGTGTPSAVSSANLNNFIGTNPNGTWSLYIFDDASTDVGTLGSWSLEITSQPSLTYGWSPGTGLTSTSISNPTATPPTTTTYTLTTTVNGCSASDAVVVTVTSPPNAGTLSGTQAICVSGTTTFTSNGNTGGTWTTSNSAIATVNSSTGVITGVSAGTATITYTVTGTGGCANATATRTVTVTTPPNAGTLSGTQAICAGGTTTFTSNGNTGGTWTTSNGAIATVNSSTGVITGVAAGTATITYTVTGTGGCANATATRTVTVTTPPKAGTLSGTQAICAGGTTTFTSNGNTGGTWTTSNGAIATVNSS
ncbi:MAG: beta strand repeat-containing protein, partial [Bacteroidota bacterium]